MHNFVGLMISIPELEFRLHVIDEVGGSVGGLARKFLVVGSEWSESAWIGEDQLDAFRRLSHSWHPANNAEEAV